VMWQFAEATRGLADACLELGVPVTGGNVSFYNPTGATPINPTPVVGVLGVADDVTRRVPSGFTNADEVVLLLGDSADEFGGSEWAWVVHSHLGGRPPAVRLEAERALAGLVGAAIGEQLLSAAHDVSDGGLAIALAEAALWRGVGVSVTLEGDAFAGLFGESTARAVVACPDASVDRVLALAAEAGVPVARLGRTGGQSVAVDGVFDVPLNELRGAHEGTLPALFG
jgi:phosphoribosylformylglycinamidine synthase subunit PurL